MLRLILVFSMFLCIVGSTEAACGKGRIKALVHKLLHPLNGRGASSCGSATMTYSTTTVTVIRQSAGACQAPAACDQKK